VQALKVASSGTNALSERPGEEKGYTGKRAAGRAAMRAPGPAVAPEFNDEQVSAAKAQVPFAQFAGQVSFRSWASMSMVALGSRLVALGSLPLPSTHPGSCRSLPLRSSFPHPPPMPMYLRAERAQGEYGRGAWRCFASGRWMPQYFTREGGSCKIGKAWQRKADETLMAEYVA
jgi:hypothetical protein